MSLVQVRGALYRPQLPVPIDQPALQASEKTVGMVLEWLPKKVKVELLNLVVSLRSRDRFSGKSVGHHVTLFNFVHLADGDSGIPPDLRFRAQIRLTGNG